MTRPELVLLTAAIMLALWTVAGLYNYYLNEAKVAQVRVLLEGLGQAAAAHAEVTGTYPPGRPDDASGPALLALQRVDASAARIEELRSPLLFFSHGKLRCVDPWGTSLRYLTAESDHLEHRRRVQFNGDVPIFESAGPDRDFGDTVSARRVDNICGDDPMYAPSPGENKDAEATRIEPPRRVSSSSGETRPTKP
jgi:hypothetical protein